MVGKNKEIIFTRQSTDFLLKYFTIVGINLVAFGFELCASAGFTYIPPLLLKNGFNETSLTALMGIGPFISLLTVPAIGHCSDRCVSRFGRRRPFILALGLLLILSLLIIPFSKEISIYSFGILGDVFILVVGVILLDFSSQALMNPTKALIPDILKTNEEQNTGFIAFSCMLSLGGCVGYLASSINWTETQIGYTFGGQERAVFCLLALSFTVLLFINLHIAKEINIQRKLSLNGCTENIYLDLSVKDNIQLNGEYVFDPENRSNIECTSSDTSQYDLVKIFDMPKYFAKMCSRVILFCISIPRRLICATKYNTLRFLNMPPALINLFVSSLFGWMGIMCHDLYYTDFVGQVIYQGKPKDLNETVSLNLYNEGVRMGSWGLLLHCLSAAVYAPVQEPLIRMFGQRAVYLFGLSTFSLSLLGTVLTKNIIFVNCFAALSGTGLAVITTVPYSLVAKFYSRKDFQVVKDRGIGEDLAVLDSAFYLAQIIPSFFLGYIVKITGSPSTYMVVATLCGIASSIYSFFISFDITNDKWFQ